MSKRKFQLYWEDGDKEIIISDDNQFSISMDYDDVDHDTVMKDAKKLVNLLNKYWK